MLGRQRADVQLFPTRGLAAFGAATMFEAQKSMPVQTGVLFGRGPTPSVLRSSRKYSEVNTENHAPVIVVTQSAPQVSERSVMSRLRSRYAVLPLPGSGGQ